MLGRLLSMVRSAARARLFAWPLGASVALAVLLTSCSTTPIEALLEPRECSDVERALLDHSLTELGAIEAYMDEALGRRFADDAPRYGEMVESLMAVRSDGNLGCAAPRENGEEGWAAMFTRGGSKVFVNVEAATWEQAMKDWTLGQEYGPLSTAEVVERIETMDSAAYGAFELAAQCYFRGPATVCRSLAHEGAHMTTNCCSHTFESIDSEVDFVDEVGDLAFDAIYFERWHPERVWLDQLYREAQQNSPAQSNLEPPKNK